MFTVIYRKRCDRSWENGV